MISSMAIGRLRFSELPSPVELRMWYIFLLMPESTYPSLFGILKIPESEFRTFPDPPISSQVLLEGVCRHIYGMAIWLYLDHRLVIATSL